MREIAQYQDVRGEWMTVSEHNGRYLVTDQMGNSPQSDLMPDEIIGYLSNALHSASYIARKHTSEKNID